MLPLISFPPQILHKRLGVLALGLLVEAEPRAFLKRIPVFLPLVHSCLLLREVERVNEKSEGVSEDGKDEGSGAENGPSGMDEGGAGGRSLEGKVRAKDRLLFSTLSTLNKMCVECELLGSNSSLAQDMDATWGEGRGQWGGGCLVHEEASSMRMGGGVIHEEVWSMRMGGGVVHKEAWSMGKGGA